MTSGCLLQTLVFTLQTALMRALLAACVHASGSRTFCVSFSRIDVTGTMPLAVVVVPLTTMGDIAPLATQDFLHFWQMGGCVAVLLPGKSDW